MSATSIRLGVDIGGTFTDVVLESGQDFYSTKVLTTYSAPENAIIEGLHKVCELSGVRPAQIEQIIHGTTLATNALIERRGAKTAFITTDGFRDVIEMRTESRFEQYDLNLQLPEPLLPRHRRYTLQERINAKGEVMIELQRSDIEQLVNQIVAADYESVAVGFLHSYVNDAHEQLVLDVLKQKMPDVMVSLSSEVSPQMREYERFNTVIANAYIKPLMKSYLGRLTERLGDEGVDCSIFLMHSGGGIISIDSAAEFPVRLVESGPAGGAVFAANIAARYGLDKVLSFDMGGTTAKICLIKNQTPKTSRVFEVARTYRFKKGSGMPISIPVIDMVEIGAGGGSLAHVDNLRQIRVGPESAGSEPGPACYGRGGERPAVTDANLMLGKLDADNFAGGSITLDRQGSATALDNHLARELGMDTETAAFGLVEVVDENMANAARVHAVENGEDLAEYTMIAFGGAAPLHASRLCEKLGIERLLIPPGAGVGSAIGFLRAPFSFEATRSVYMKLSDFDAPMIRQILQELETEATRFVRSCDKHASILTDTKLYMRYSGQGWEIPVSLTTQQAEHPDSDTFQTLFDSEYTKLFGRPVEGIDVEITVWSVNATTPRQEVERLEELAIKQTAEHNAAYKAQASAIRRLHNASTGTMDDAAVVERDAVQVGDLLTGPTIITEDETTIIMPAGYSGVRQSDGCIDLRRNRN